MAIAEDVRNLFREFDGRAESYIEFVPGVPAHPVNGHSRNAGPESQPVGSVGDEYVPAATHAAPPPDNGRLEAVFARLASRSA